MRKQGFRFFLLALTASPWLLLGQVPYPFSGTEAGRDILAYWYNVPAEKNVDMGKMGSVYFQSSLQIYGTTPAERFKVSVQVFDKSYNLYKAEKSDLVSYHGDLFKLCQPVEHLPGNPERIIVAIESVNGRRSKDILCRYHRISGRVTESVGPAHKAYVIICPDAFFEFIGKYTDDKGDYEIELPERTYNALAASTNLYGISQTESWAWHVINDCDQTLNFRIGNSELYNLNAWTSNGGDSTYFISFRPMVIEWVVSQGAEPVQISQKEFSRIATAPELEISDMKVTVNGRSLSIVSLQKFYETGYTQYAFPHYILQADCRAVRLNDKLHIQLELQKEADWQEKRISCYGMGQFQI
jgi:hypothetical protein